MLFRINDVVNVKAVESSTRGSRYQPSCCTVGSTAASRAVAPAGGYMVFVKVMTADASPHASAAASHRSCSKFWLMVKSLVIPIPIAVAMAWPKMVLRG